MHVDGLNRALGMCERTAWDWHSGLASNFRLEVALQLYTFKFHWAGQTIFLSIIHMGEINRVTRHLPAVSKMRKSTNKILSRLN
jgi:hypothetical protein